VVVGSSRDLPVEMQDDLLDDAGVRGGLDRDETNQKGQNKAGENKLNAWEEDTWRELEFSAPDSISSTEGRKGGLICTSRCGRCQVCPSYLLLHRRYIRMDADSRSIGNTTSP